jgi:hypothetical protein
MLALVSETTCKVGVYFLKAGSFIITNVPYHNLLDAARNTLPED